MKITLIIIFIAVTVISTSCTEQADLIIINHSHSPIVVIGRDGRRNLNIPTEERATIMFPGDQRAIQIATANVEKEYFIGHYPPREFRGKRYPYKVVVVFKDDSALYICYADGREAPIQPIGFPVTPAEN